MVIQFRDIKAQTMKPGYHKHSSSSSVISVKLSKEQLLSLLQSASSSLIIPIFSKDGSKKLGISGKFRFYKTKGNSVLF